MIQLSMSVLLVAGLFGSAASESSAWAGASIHSAETQGRQVLAWLDGAEPSRSGARSVAPGMESEAAGGVEVDAYIRFHLETAAGDARSQLMPWPELRSFAQ